MNALAGSTSAMTPNRRPMRTPSPMVGWMSGSTAGPLIAVLVPKRMETRRVSRRTRGAAAPAWMAQTPASWLRYAKGYELPVVRNGSRLTIHAGA